MASTEADFGADRPESERSAIADQAYWDRLSANPRRLRALVSESLRTRLERWAFNLSPVVRGTGAWASYVAADYSEVRIRLPLSWRTRNYVGTIFGGSMYGAIDPVYMLMLIKRLGSRYIVWDKAATIRFRRPGRTTLHATFLLPDPLLQTIRSAADAHGKTEHTFHVDLTDAEGTPHASFEKLVSIRRKPD